MHEWLRAGHRVKRKAGRGIPEPMEQSAGELSADQKGADHGRSCAGPVPEWQLRAVAGPALVRLGDRAVPGALRLGLDLVIQQLQDALGEVLRRTVQLRLAPVGMDGAPVVNAPGQTPGAFCIAFQHPSFPGEASVTLSLTAARAIVEPLSADLADLRGYGELSGPECGLLEYVSLATVDRVLKAWPRGSAGFVFTRFADAAEMARQASDRKAGPTGAPPEPVVLELVVSGRRGLVQLACEGWLVDEANAADSVLDSGVTSRGAVAGDGAPVDVRLGLPAITISRQEFQAIENGDTLLLGRTTLKSFASGCALITTTGWELGAVELCDDTSTLVSVRCGTLRPTVRPELMRRGETASVTLRPAMGLLRLTTKQLGRWRGGDVVDLPTDPVAPVELYKGMAGVGKGELVTVDGELGIRLTEFDPRAK